MRLCRSGNVDASLIEFLFNLKPSVKIHLLLCLQKPDFPPLTTSPLTSNLKRTTKTNKMTNTFTFAWELSQVTLQLLAGNCFQKRLASILTHTLLLGIHLAAGSGLVSGPGSDTPAFTRLNRYIKKAIKDQIGQDKFYPLRSCSTSAGYMRTHLNFNSRSELDIFQIAIWRVYCFGYEQRFKDLTLTANITQPDLVALQIAIERHISHGNVKLSMAPYGQLMIPRKDLATMLQKLWRFAQHFAKSENQSASFSVMYEWICMDKIPSLPRHGLLTCRLLRWPPFFARNPY